jgi:hypothetical protein
MSEYYQLPEYIEEWIDVAFRRIPKGWDIVAYPDRGAVQILDNMKRVKRTYGYHAIHEGFELPEEWDDE